MWLVWTNWVMDKRPKGPQYTYGRSLRKTLKKAGIDTEIWHQIAQDRPILDKQFELLILILKLICQFYVQ